MDGEELLPTDAPTSIDLHVHVWKSGHHASRTLVVEADLDGTLALALTEIAGALACEPGDVCSWVYDTVPAASVVDSVFGAKNDSGRRFVSRREAVVKCRWLLTDVDVQIPEDVELLNAEDLLALLPRDVEVRRPTLQLASVLVPVNPFGAIADDAFARDATASALRNASGVDAVPDLRTTLASVLRGTDAVHVVLRRDVASAAEATPALQSLYFPPHEDMALAASEAAERRSRPADLAVPRDAVSVDEGIVSVDLRVDASSARDTDVEAVFASTPLDMRVPFSSFSVGTATTLKVHVPFLAAGDGNLEDVREYCEDAIERTAPGVPAPRVVFRAHAPTTVAAWTLILTEPVGQVAVRVATSRDRPLLQTDVLDGLRGFWDAVRDTVLRGATGDPRARVRRMTTRVALSVPGAELSPSQIVGAVRDHFRDFFDVATAPSRDDGAHTLFYKRADGYAPPTEVRRFILQNRKVDRPQVMSALVQKYALDESTALREYTRTLQARAVKVEVASSSGFGVVATLINLTSPRQHARIRELLRAAAAIAANIVERPVPDKGRRRPPKPAAAHDEFLDLLVVEDDPQDAAAAPDGPLRRTTPPQHLIQQLRAADRGLFGYRGRRGYASDCQKPFQPVIVTDDELARMPDGTVAVGFEGRQKNWFVCPRAWCPRSRVAVEPGSPCPGGPDESPIPDDPVWAKARGRHVGFRRSRNGMGRCVPCCFKTAHNLSTEECGAIVRRVNAPDAEAAGSVKTDGARYIRSAPPPLRTGNLGAIPHPASAILSDGTVCGTRDDGSGIISKGADCFVRRGVPMAPQPQPFLESLRVVLDVRRTADLVERITEADPILFVFADAGRAVRRFADPVPLLRADARFALRSTLEHLESHPAYVDRLGLAGVRRRISAAVSRGREADAMTHPDVVRETVVASALRNFRAYMRDASVLKTHDAILDIAYGLESVNPDARLPIVIEQMPGSDVVHVHVPAMGQKTVGTVVIYRQGAFYEPICRVRLAGNGSLAQTHVFPPTDVAALLATVRTARPAVLERLLADGLGSQTPTDALRIVIDSNYCAVGILETSTGVVLPLPDPEPICAPAVTHRFAFADRIPSTTEHGPDVRCALDMITRAERACPGCFRATRATRTGIELDGGRTVASVAARASLDLAILASDEGADPSRRIVDSLLPRDYVATRQRIGAALAVDAALASDVRVLSEGAPGVPGDVRVSMLRARFSGICPDAPSAVIHRVADEVARSPAIFGWWTASGAPGTGGYGRDLLIRTEDISAGVVDDILRAAAGKTAWQADADVEWMPTLVGGGQRRASSHALVAFASEPSCVREIAIQVLGAHVPDELMPTTFRDVPDALDVAVVAVTAAGTVAGVLGDHQHRRAVAVVATPCGRGVSLVVGLEEGSAVVPTVERACAVGVDAVKTRLTVRKRGFAWPASRRRER